jgi:Peptidase C39 family
MNLNPAAVPTFLLAIAVFWVGFCLAGRSVSVMGRATLIVLAVLLAVPGVLNVLYYAHLFDGATWYYNFRTLPHSELMGAGLALLFGVLQRLLHPHTVGEKLIAPFVLVSLLFVPFMKSVLDPVDYSQLRHSCESEVCLQSTPSTCGPTSAATLLKLFGLSASEEELARECLTYRGGTEIWYVARAFRERGLTTVFVIQSPDHISPPAPAIAGVVLPGGAGHFIAILGDNADTVSIGDPLEGKILVPRDKLNSAYKFTGFFLVIGPGATHR